jgi:hypothetical protein
MCCCLLQQVRRQTALPSAKEAARAVDSRSLYVRPFPMHASLDQIVSFFQDASVQLNAVRVRRHLRSRDFKGSVFIEASSVEEAQRVSSGMGRACPGVGWLGRCQGVQATAPGAAQILREVELHIGCPPSQMVA